MRPFRLSCIVLLAFGTAVACWAQGWAEAYGRAVASAKAGNWADARKQFKEAAALRPEDQSNPTLLPGPVTEPRKWRGGAPYSPNFGAAYAALREAGVTKDDGERKQLYTDAVAELETLLRKNQNSPETLYFLNQAYTAVREVEKARALEAKVADLVKAKKVTWRVDTEFVAPEELAAVASAFAATSAMTKTGDTTTIPASSIGKGNAGTIPAASLNNQPNAGTSVAGRVPVVTTKYALIIGNTEGRLPDVKLDFAASDAMLVREALVQHAGYADENVDVVTNGTAAQILKSAQALASRMPDDGTVFIFFSGAGVNLDGKDYLAGVDTEQPTDTTTMVAKADLFRLFMAKGARIFAFYQVSRPIVSGRYFGMEAPLVGAISQVQGTIPGSSAYGYMREGKLVGVFARAMASVLADYRSNRIPISDFAWAVFYAMRKGGTDGTGGGSVQTPTLPMITNMPSDARF